jgi:hypothetical protein
MTKYSLFEPLKGDTPLEKFLNETFSHLDVVKMICSPDHFNEKRLEKSAVMYYRLELYESYCHKLVSKMKELQREIELYKTEFKYNWRDYATTKKQELVNEFGYDPDDYDDDGNLKPITDEVLRHYDFYNLHLNYNCIIFNKKLSHFVEIFLLLEKSNNFSINKFPPFENIDTYREVNGELIKNEFEDTVLADVKKAHVLDTSVKLLMKVVGTSELIFDSFNEVDSKHQDELFFSRIEEYVNQVINLQIKLA